MLQSQYDNDNHHTLRHIKREQSIVNKLRQHATQRIAAKQAGRGMTMGEHVSSLPDAWLDKLINDVAIMRNIYIHMLFCAPWRRRLKHDVIIHSSYHRHSNSGTTSWTNIAHLLLLVPIIDDDDDDKHIIGYHIPLTELGKASRKTTDMHIKISQPDLVILIQLLHAAMRKMLYINLQENAKNSRSRDLLTMRQEVHEAILRTENVLTEPGEFTKSPYYPYYHTVTKDMARQLPSQLRRALAQRFLKKKLLTCNTRDDVKRCIAELARSMETSRRTVIQTYTNFIMMTPIALNEPTKDKGVYKDGLVDVMTPTPTRASSAKHVRERTSPKPRANSASTGTFTTCTISSLRFLLLLLLLLHHRQIGLYKLEHRSRNSCSSGKTLHNSYNNFIMPTLCLQ
jgi:hypothetical protein